MKNRAEIPLSQKRKLTAGTLLPLVAIVLILGFQNWSPGTVQSAKVDSLSATSDTDALDLDQDTKPVTVAYSENLTASLQQLTGVKTLSAETLRTITDTKNGTTESGKADSINAPMMIGLANLAGDMCFDLIKEEKAKTDSATRRFFTKIDFGRGPADISSDAQDDVIRRMSRNFWGRNETLAEKALIRSTLAESLKDEKPVNFASDQQETENALLLVCASMLSSLDSIRF